jgi:hypothetical protein
MAPIVEKSYWQHNQIPNKTTSFGRIKSCDMIKLISVLLVLITFFGFM